MFQTTLSSIRTGFPVFTMFLVTFSTFYTLSVTAGNTENTSLKPEVVRAKVNSIYKELVLLAEKHGVAASITPDAIKKLIIKGNIKITDLPIYKRSGFWLVYSEHTRQKEFEKLHTDNLAALKPGPVTRNTTVYNNRSQKLGSLYIILNGVCSTKMPMLLRPCNCEKPVWIVRAKSATTKNVCELFPAIMTSRGYKIVEINGTPTPREYVNEF